MVDLNDPNYTPELITKEYLLSKYTEEEIFKYYIGDFDLGTPMKSPIRSGDEVPSFNIFYSRRHGCLLFKDFAGKRGDFVRLVQELLGIRTYQEALSQIAKDMSSEGVKVITRNTSSKKDYDKQSFNHISIVTKEWDQDELDYWHSFGISLPTLKYFNVYPISGYYYNMYYIDTPDLAFAYVEYKDDKLTYKIYRPTADKRHKWRNNNPFGVHQGYRQLPETGKLLIITKSLKDVMSICENAHIPSIGVQSETCFIKDTVIEEYKTRFDRVVTLFDNDEQGINQAESYKKMYDIQPIFIPDRFGVKDFSDLVKTINKFRAIFILKKELSYEISHNKRWS